MRLVHSCIILALAIVAFVNALETSNDGTCGNGVSCLGSLFGGCCSADGRCGATSDYCGTGCQIKYGFCQNTWGKLSPDGTCGGKPGFMCKDSGFGDCCSEYNFCGSEEGHCGAKCQPQFGNCGTNSASDSLRLLVSEALNTTSLTEVPTSTQSSSIPGENPALETISATSKVLDRRAQHTGPYKAAPSCPSIDESVFESPCGAQFQVQCATDRSGGDVHWSGNGFYVETVQDCLDACAHYPGCINVAWVKGLPKGACYLKNKLGPSYSHDWVHGGVLIRNCTSTSSSTSSTATSLTFSTVSTSSTVLTASAASISSTGSTDTLSWTTSTGLSASTSLTTSISSTDSTASIVSTSSSVLINSTSPISSTASVSAATPAINSTASVTAATPSINSTASISSTFWTNSTISISSTASVSAATPSINSTVSISSTASIGSTFWTNSAVSISSTASVSAATPSINPTVSISSAPWTNSTGPVSITTVTPTTFINTASTLSTRVSQSSSACTAQPTVISDSECVPCEGQGGSLPYCGADVTTDNYKFTPKTCRTVKYTLDITNTTVAPDGRPRIALLVNGQLPGPLIEANWGDTVEVTVNNKMQNNGTTIHFHGIRQLNNSEYDGVPSITQCPIAPGDSMVYRFVATNYGTSWYHSHFAIQAWEGVMGPMIIHGPSSKQWDVDAGTIMLQDWSQRTVDSMYDEAQDAVSGGARQMDNGLINGKNTWGVEGTANQTGERFELETKFEPGKTYLLRVINSAIQSTYKFYIDGHSLEVINMDFTAIEPYTTNILNINIGQRYMVLVRANQPAGNYWMRADNQNACAATIQATDIKGIIRYSGSNSTSVPTSTAYNYTTECVDEPLSSLVPMAPLSATNSDITETYDITIAGNEARLFKWYLSGTTFFSRFEDPTLLSVLNNGTVPSYSGNLMVDLPQMHQWVYIVIQSAIPLPHPIHLHGHDFFILATGSGTYTPGSTLLNLQNPPRRDTANMPAAGFLVVAFETDNPGAWLMHCHVGWHTSMGFALQFIEGKSMVSSTVKDTCALQETCKGWNNWVAETGFQQHDSGV